MPYKLIAFDLDGTLLDDNKKIPAENLNALEEAARQNLLLVPATGRIMPGLPEELLRLPFLRYFICSNGAYVYDRQEDKVLYKGEIPLELALRVIEYMDTLPVIYDCYQYDMGWVTASMYDQAEEYFVDQPFMLELFYRLRRKVDSLPETLRQRGDGIQKLQMHFRTRDLDEKQRQLQILPTLFPEIVSTTSVKNNIEMNSRDAGKGKALAALCESLSINISETVAFGDGTNDTELLKAAGLGVAMANADEQVKAAADMVTAANNEAGIAKALKELLG